MAAKKKKRKISKTKLKRKVVPKPKPPAPERKAVVATVECGIRGTMELKVRIFHEYSRLGDRHRIVTAYPYHGKMVFRRGKWAAKSRIAELKDYRAATRAFKGVLPEGVFFTSRISHETVK
jgi:hypothetical protein